MNRRSPSFVYFLRPVGADGPVKIGCSAFPGLRLQTMMSWSPLPLELVAKTPGDETLEWRFHAAFRDQHSHGEWFHGSPRLTEVMEAIRAGETDFSFLPANARQLRIGRRPIVRSPARRQYLSLVARASQLNGHSGLCQPDCITAALKFVRDNEEPSADRDAAIRLVSEYCDNPLAHGAQVSRFRRDAFFKWCGRRGIDPSAHDEHQPGAAA